MERGVQDGGALYPQADGTMTKTTEEIIDDIHEASDLVAAELILSITRDRTFFAYTLSKKEALEMVKQVLRARRGKV